MIRGDQRGRLIGFPTANLAEIDVVIPAPGVYGGTSTIADVTYAAAIHIGPRPTFDPPTTFGKPTGDERSSHVEVHLLDYTGDLYGHDLSVDVITRVRDIARFDSPDDLAKQLALDVKTVRESVASIRPIRR